MNINDKEKYIIVGFISDKSTTYSKGHLVFLGRHGKYPYMTCNDKDKCICKFDTKEALSEFYHNNEAKIKEEAKFWCVSFLYIGHKTIQLDNFLDSTEGE